MSLPGSSAMWTLLGTGAIVGTLVVMGLVAWQIAAAVGWGLGETLLAVHVAFGLAAAGLTLGLWRLDGFLDRFAGVGGRIAVDAGEVGVEGALGRRVGFRLDDKLRIRCASYRTDGDAPERTYLLLEREGRAAVCASRGFVRGWTGEIAVQREPLDLPQDALVVDLEQAALEEIMREIDDELERRVATS